MASRRRSSAVTLDAQADGGPADVVRRAPFADNPHVGARGQRTQQRILDAALEAFARGLPPVQHRLDHEARRLLARGVLSVLLEQGGRLPPADGPGGARAERLDRGPGAADARARQAGSPFARGSPATRRSTAATSRCSTRLRRRRRATTGRQRLCALERADRLEDPLADRDHPAPAPRARSGDHAAPGVRHPHPRRGPDPPLGRTRALRRGSRRRRPGRCHPPLLVRAPGRRQRPPPSARSGPRPFTSTRSSVTPSRRASRRPI